MYVSVCMYVSIHPSIYLSLPFEIRATFFTFYAYAYAFAFNWTLHCVGGKDVAIRELHDLAQLPCSISCFLRRFSSKVCMYVCMYVYAAFISRERERETALMITQMFLFFKTGVRSLKLEKDGVEYCVELMLVPFKRLY